MGSQKKSDSIYNIELKERLAEKALNRPYLTNVDRELINRFITKKKARKKAFSPVTAYNLKFVLAQWRQWIQRPYDQLTTDDIDEGLARLKAAKTSKGEPYTNNSIYSYIANLKNFLYWLSREEIIQVPLEYINKDIELPTLDFETEGSEDLLTVEEVLRMIEAVKNPKHRALIATIYEGGLRAGELARLQWKDVQFDDHGVELKVTDTKEHKTRENWLKFSRPYLATWKAQHPDGMNKDAYVFQCRNGGEMLGYQGLCYILTKAAKAAGIKKRVHLHLLRKSRITHMFAGGYNESVIKEVMWKNQGTEMTKIYVKLSKKDTQRELKKKAGVPVDGEELQVQEIRTRRCLRCDHENAPTDDTCRECGFPLTKDAMDTEKDLDEWMKQQPEYLEVRDAFRQIQEKLKTKT